MEFDDKSTGWSYVRAGSYHAIMASNPSILLVVFALALEKHQKWGQGPLVGESVPIEFLDFIKCEINAVRFCRCVKRKCRCSYLDRYLLSLWTSQSVPLLITPRPKASCERTLACE